MGVMRVPNGFAKSIRDFQKSIEKELGVKVPQCEILRGLAPKVDDLMRRKKEVIERPNNRRKSWRLNFL